MLGGPFFKYYIILALSLLQYSKKLRPPAAKTEELRPAKLYCFKAVILYQKQSIKNFPTTRSKQNNNFTHQTLSKLRLSNISYHSSNLNSLEMILFMKHSKKNK